jgi:rRNA small subunit pseudouridine methyltransferase Nep1
MLTLVLVESALETIPRQLWSNSAVRKFAEQRAKPPRSVILDRSYHHSAMKKLEHNEKRGRPDIVHFALLEALGSPLNKQGLLQVYVHTLNDHIISVRAETRLPRNCNRFVSLAEQLFEFGRIPPEQTEAPLLKVERQTLTQLVHDQVKPSYVLAFSRVGKPKTLEEAISKLTRQERPTVFIGGFPHGHYSKGTATLADEIVSIDSDMLETWTVVSRVIYEFERALSLPKKRLW